MPNGDGSVATGLSSSETAWFQNKKFLGIKIKIQRKGRILTGKRLRSDGGVSIFGVGWG